MTVSAQSEPLMRPRFKPFDPLPKRSITEMIHALECVIVQGTDGDGRAVTYRWFQLEESDYVDLLVVMEFLIRLNPMRGAIADLLKRRAA